MSKTRKAIIIALAAAGLAAGIAASGGSAGTPVASAPSSYYHA